MFFILAVHPRKVVYSFPVPFPQHTLAWLLLPPSSSQVAEVSSFFVNCVQLTSPAHSPFQQQFRSTSLTVQATKKQIYTIPTYDSAFKHVLRSDTVRLSFLLAFVPNLNNVTSSKLLDENMNPVGNYQSLRHFLHGKNLLALSKA